MTCSQSVFNKFSILNKLGSVQLMIADNYLILAGSLVLTLALQLVRRSSTALELESKKYIDLPSTYSILLRRLPEGYTQSDIEEMIENRRGELDQVARQETNNLKVDKIILSYSLRESLEVQERNTKQFKKATKDKQPFQAQLALPPTRVAPLVVVTFQMQQSKDMFLQKPSTLDKFIQCFWPMYIPESRYQVKGKRISIQVAPEPDDINWYNCGISYKGSVCRRILGKVCVFLLLILGMGFQVGLQKAQTLLLGKELKYMSIVFSVVVLIFNALLALAIEVMTKKWRLETVTEQTISIASSISLLQFANSGIIVMFSNLLVDFEKFNLDTLSQNIITIMLMNVALPHIQTLFLDGFRPVKRWKRWSINRGRQVYTQREVNEAYQNSDCDIACKSVYIVKTVWLTMFYAPFVPLVIPISIFGILLYFHAQKYMYQKHYKVPNMISTSLTKQLLDLMDFGPILMAVGNYFLYVYFSLFKFDSIPKYFCIPIYTNLVLSSLYALSPSSRVNEYVFKFQQNQLYKPPIQEVRDNFVTDYQQANPTSNEGCYGRSKDPHLKNAGECANLFNYLSKPPELKQMAGPASTHRQPTEWTELVQKPPILRRNLILKHASVSKCTLDQNLNILQNPTEGTERGTTSLPLICEQSMATHYLQIGAVNSVGMTTRRLDLQAPFLLNRHAYSFEHIRATINRDLSLHFSSMLPEDWS